MVSQHALRQDPPESRMTDRCKNITLPQTSFEGGNEVRVPARGVVNRYLRGLDELWLGMLDSCTRVFP